MKINLSHRAWRAVAAVHGLVATVPPALALEPESTPVEPVAAEAVVPEAKPADSIAIDLPRSPQQQIASWEADAEAPADRSPLSVQINLDVASAYFFRGIRQEDRGLMFQPALKINYTLVNNDRFKVDAFASTWNSFHTRKTAAEERGGGFIGHYYEADGTIGATLTVGQWSFTGAFVVLASPSNAFGTVQELDFTIALDDSKWLGAWSLKPYALVATEIGSNGSDGKNSDTGSYLELGIGPGFTIDAGKTPVTFTFPLTIGLSLDKYYQDSAGNDETFGFVQLGGKVSFPLPVDKGWGDWSLSAGVYGLFFGSHTADYNAGERTQMLGTVGVQVGF